MSLGPILRALRHNRTRAVLLVLEVGMTLAVVANCVNVILATRATMTVPSGFDDDHIVRILVKPFTPDHRDPRFLGARIPADLRELAAIPGVRAVSNTHFELWEGGGSSTGVRAVGGGGLTAGTQQYAGTVGLVEALGARIVEGRDFREGEDGSGGGTPADVTVISKALADVLFPEGGAVGKVLEEATDDGRVLGPPQTVVGVLERFYNPWGIGADRREPIEERVMFQPRFNGSYERGIPYLVRVEPGAMSSVVAEAEKRLTAAHPGRVLEVTPTGQKRGRFLSGSKMVVTMLSCLAVTLVVVTALGILGLTSLSVTERTRQIGTRRALGATRTDILVHFLAENGILTGAGIVLGVAGAYALDVALVSRVSEVTMDGRLVAAGVGLLWLLGLAATVPPALRAAGVPPSTATRAV